jgi:hypothetical protein
MQLSLSRLALGALVLGVLSACGGGGTDPNGGGGGGGGGGAFGMTARIDGAAWAPSFAASGAHGSAGVWNFVGVSTAAGGSSIMISLYNIRGPGTYPLGVNVTGIGGIAQVIKGSKGWGTALTGVAGTITIDTVSNTRLVGTFSFSAVGISGGATGTVEVTEGVFKVAVTTIGNPGTLPDNAGHRLTVSSGDKDYNAGTISASFPNDTSMIVASSNTVDGLGIQLAGIHGTGSYALSASSPLHVLTFSTYDGANFSVWGGVAGDVGSIVITSLTASRIQGTFNVTLQPSTGPAATGPINLVGDFDLGIP